MPMGCSLAQTHSRAMANVSHNGLVSTIRPPKTKKKKKKPYIFPLVIFSFSFLFSFGDLLIDNFAQHCFVFFISFSFLLIQHWLDCCITMNDCERCHAMMICHVASRSHILYFYTIHFQFIWLPYAIGIEPGFCFGNY